jgi:CRP-like cAMP-binding protein
MDINLVEELRRMPIFQMLSADEVQSLEPFLVEKNYAKGAVIFCERETGNSLYLVKKGTVRITRSVSGVKREIIIFQPGDFFGEVALFDAVLRTATAVAIGPVILYEINREALGNFIIKNSAVAAKVLYRVAQELASRLRRKTREDDDTVI